MLRGLGPILNGSHTPRKAEQVEGEGEADKPQTSIRVPTSRIILLEK